MKKRQDMSKLAGKSGDGIGRGERNTATPAEKPHLSRIERVKSDLRSQEARYRGVVETAADGFWALDHQGRLLDVNEAYVRLSGYSREQLLTMTIFQLEARETPEQAAAHLPQILQRGQGRFQALHRAKDGHTWPVEIVASYCADGGCFFAFCTDLSARKRQEELLRVTTGAFQSTSEAISVTDAAGRIVAINPAFTQLTGYGEEEILGHNPKILSSGHHDSEFYRKMWAELNETGHWQGELWDRRKDGALIIKWLTINTIYNNDGSVRWRVGLFSDITRKKQSEESMWRHANLDQLTQLPNRYVFYERLEMGIRNAKRTRTSLALLFIDLDRFQEVNDMLGYLAGDALIVEAGRRISACVREADTVARFGGAGFTVILNGRPEEADIERVAQGIIDNLAIPFSTGDGEAHISGSIGIALYPRDAADSRSLINNADKAMHLAKRHGRNRFSYFTNELQEKAQQRMRLIADLHNALPNEQLKVYFQPIVELATGRIHKAEALLRWRHPERGMVSPADFIPVTEDTGFINEIGDWAFVECARWAKRWINASPDGFQISINNSPVQLTSDGSLFNLAWFRYLESQGLLGSNFVIELTEGLLLNESEAVAKKLRSFREAGVQLAIDDFGIGFSALSYLKHFDVDYLKIDKTFVHGIESEKKDRALIRAIVVMAHALGIKVIAEGVETPGQRNFLAKAGCDYAQGFMFCGPLPPEEFESLLIPERNPGHVPGCSHQR
jgi:diguanylate cyclase (GGDEF)-like protein/PAS domain S-box-containing protein